jgi:hypothetical protein
LPFRVREISGEIWNERKLKAKYLSRGIRIERGASERTRERGREKKREREREGERTKIGKVPLVEVPLL